MVTKINTDKYADTHGQRPSSRQCSTWRFRVTIHSSLDPNFTVVHDFCPVPYGQWKDAVIDLRGMVVDWQRRSKNPGYIHSIELLP